LNTRNLAELEQYEALRKRLKAEGAHCFRTWGSGGSHYRPELDGIEVDLEDKHLFSNQWNTAPIPDHSDTGLRVFDWAEDYPINFSHSIKRGHYLDITPAMREARHNNVKCSYCGHMQRIEAAPTFCDRCLDSEYLTEKDLPLLRLRRIDDERKDFDPLTDGEREWLLPKFREAQTSGATVRGRARIADKRRRIAEDYAKAIRVATAERDGFLWLMDHGINPSNVIYYSHTERFCFGWQKPCAPDFVSSLLDVITEFNFPYDIKCEDGRTLSGN
jgi:hypothetical protein